MKREEHLRFCKTCTNRKPNFQVGLVCGLTDKIADFENNCEFYSEDVEVVENIDNEDVLAPDEILTKFSEENLEKFKQEQNLTRGITASIFTGLLSAISWGVITVLTNFQIGFMAIAIGAIVGLTMRAAGKGIDVVFGISGVIIAVMSCLLGNFFSIIGFIANQENLGYIETLFYFDYSQLLHIMGITFKPMDLVFYVIAGAEGYKFSFRAFTEKDVYELEKK